MLYEKKEMKSFIFSIVLLMAVGCASRPAEQTNGQKVQLRKETSATREARINEHQLNALVWFQSAAEVTALQHMAYNVAKDRLQWEMMKAKKMKKGGKNLKKKAIILDIDETVLDNSAYQAHNMFTGDNYPVGWQEWVDKAKAREIAGAKDFLLFAEKMGVEIFFVTNRKTSETEATYKNFADLGIPHKKENFFFRTESSGKEPRRKNIEKNHEVILLLGDNLGDFSDVFEKKLVGPRMNTVHELKEFFGRKWIVLPNSVYGDWESSLHEFNFNKSESEKDQDRLKNLNTFGYDQE